MRAAVAVAVVAAAAITLTACSGGGAPPAPVPALSSRFLSGDVEAPRGPVDSGWRVSRVVDGDTVWVTRAGLTLKVRLIGIDTPETVAPDQPVGCFGPESSAFATRVLLDRAATLEFDPSQDRTDRYGRTLAYLWLDGPAQGSYAGQYNHLAVRSGAARQYLYDRPYAWYEEFVAAESAARDEGSGLWGACPAQG